VQNSDCCLLCMSIYIYFFLFFYLFFFFFFFFTDTATTEIYTLSLHDALPILQHIEDEIARLEKEYADYEEVLKSEKARVQGSTRSEEHTSELQSRGHLVCRLLLEKKKKKKKK